MTHIDAASSLVVIPKIIWIFFEGTVGRFLRGGGIRIITAVGFWSVVGVLDDKGFLVLDRDESFNRVEGSRGWLSLASVDMGHMAFALL